MIGIELIITTDSQLHISRLLKEHVLMRTSSIVAWCQSKNKLANFCFHKTATE